MRSLRHFERQAERLGQRREDLPLAGGVHRQQDLRQRLARRLRCDRLGLRELLLGDLPALEQKRFDRLAGCARGRLPERLGIGMRFVGRSPPDRAVVERRGR